MFNISLHKIRNGYQCCDNPSCKKDVNCKKCQDCLTDCSLCKKKDKDYMDIKDLKYKTCPICGGMSIRTCKYPCGNNWCANGHSWHYCFVHKCKVIGESDNNKGFGCQCNEDVL